MIKICTKCKVPKELIEFHKDKNRRDGERVVNKFFVCVPTELVEDAKQWVEEVNPKYGIIEFITNRADKKFCANANRLIHVINQPIIEKRILKRLSSALTTEYIGKIK